MLRSGRGSLRQGAGRATSGACGVRRVLCGALRVQRGCHGAVPPQPAAAALPAGHRVQQRRQHHSNGPPGQVTVRRNHRAPLAAGCDLHPDGSYAGHGGGTAAAAAAFVVCWGAGWGCGGAEAAPAAIAAIAAAATAPGGRRSVAGGPRRGSLPAGQRPARGGGAPLGPPPAGGPMGRPGTAPAAAADAGRGSVPEAAAAAAASPEASSAGGWGWGLGPGGSGRGSGVRCQRAHCQLAKVTHALLTISPVSAVGSAVGANAVSRIGAEGVGAWSRCPARGPRPGPYRGGGVAAVSGAGDAIGGPGGAGSLSCAAAGSNWPTAEVMHDSDVAAAEAAEATSGLYSTLPAPLPPLPPAAEAAAQASSSSTSSPAAPSTASAQAAAAASAPAAAPSTFDLPTVMPAAGATSPSEYRSADLGRLGRFSHRLILSYDGTEYCGWQLQPSAPTVQRTLETALCTVLREERAVLGVRAAGRTDSGVHARGQVVQFSCNRELELEKMPYKLNSVLPHDIRVQRVCRTAPDFSVTCSALGKCYHYSLTNSETHDPLRHRYALHVRRPLDLTAMRSAAAALVGTHDFTQFSNIGEEGGRPRRRNPVKTLRRVDMVELDAETAPGGVRIEVEGNGFLYKMVRHISGALVAVGEGRLPVAAISRMLEVGSNAPPGCYGSYRGYNVAPAKGLCLHQVFYDPRVDDPSVLLYPELRHDEYGRLLESIPDARSDED